MAGFVVAYYGKDHQFYFTPDEVEAAEYLYNNAPPGSLLIEGSRNYPSQHRNYEFFTYVPIAWEPVETRQAILQDPAGVLTEWMRSDEYTASYIIITRSQKAENDMFRDHAHRIAGQDRKSPAGLTRVPFGVWQRGRKRVCSHRSRQRWQDNEDRQLGHQHLGMARAHYRVRGRLRSSSWK